MITSSLCDSYVFEIVQGVHQPGDDYRMALYDESADLSYETAGTGMLLFMGLAAAFIGGYILLRAGRERRVYAEDDPDADHAKQTGVHVGWFSAGSVWPLVSFTVSTLILSTGMGVTVPVPPRPWAFELWTCCACGSSAFFF